MSKFTIESFSGRVTKVSPRLLPVDVGQVATNCRLDSGRLVPWKGNLSIGTNLGATVKTLFKYSANIWLTSTVELDFVRSPINEDPHGRVYFTGDTYPRMAANASVVQPYPSVSYRLGLPRPSKPSVTIGGTADTGANAVSLAWTVTFVTDFGEESPPAILDATDIKEWSPGQTKTITLPSPPAGNYALSNGKWRIYRTNLNGQFQFVKEVAIATGSTTDTIDDDSALGEVMPSELWVAPPDDNSTDHPGGQMKHLTQMPNGIMAGASDRTLCFSVAYMPHAWPEEYQLTTRDTVVGLAATAAGLIVMTTGRPYFVTGSDPAGMQLIEVDANHSCVSKRSIVDMGEYAVYAGANGLVLASSSGLQLATEMVLSKDDWEWYNPSSIHAYQYDGRYIGFYDKGGGNTGGFIFDPRGGKNSWVDLDFYAHAGFYDMATGYLYLLIGGILYRFDADANSPRTVTWKSKQFHSEMLMCPAVARVNAEAYPVTFKLYADGVLKHTQTVADGEQFRLPGGYLARTFEVQLEGTKSINYVTVADSPAEMV